MRLSIIIPIFNEANVIALTLGRLKNASMPEFVQSIEVIVVDDCSTDDSAILAEGFKAENLNLKVLRLHVNSGKGEAVGAGIRASSGDTMAIQDADLELDPADLPALVEKIQSEGLDLVSGKRFRTVRKYPVHAKLAAGVNRLFSIAASLITGRKITDITCGHKVFRRNLYAIPGEKPRGKRSESKTALA